MLLFLLRVTGIPATEEQALKTRGEDYREYQRTTSAFLPLPPRAGGSPAPSSRSHDRLFRT
jgi:steroid 5-alpha reductase family enzyme